MVMTVSTTNKLTKGNASARRPRRSGIAPSSTTTTTTTTRRESPERGRGTFRVGRATAAETEAAWHRLIGSNVPRDNTSDDSASGESPDDVRGVGANERLSTEPSREELLSRISELEATNKLLTDRIDEMTAGCGAGSASGTASGSTQVDGAPVAIPVAAGHEQQQQRVNACRRLFTREKGSTRRFRHEVYAHIAEHEREVWESVSHDPVQRANAVKDPKRKTGSHPPKIIADAWDGAMAAAFDGLKFENIRGGAGTPDRPRGIWTTELAFQFV